MTSIKIETIKKWASDRLSTAILPSTAKQYEQTVLNLIASKKQAGSSDNGRTRSVERSAYRYVAANKILQFIASGQLDYAQITYKRIQSIEAKATESSERYSKGESFENSQKRQSKKLTLKNLDPDWREKLVEKSIGSKYANEIAVIVTTGCRPSEMAKGVVISKTTDGSTKFRIIGAKQKIKFDKYGNEISSGQAWRELTFPPSHPVASKIEAGRYVAKASAIEEAIKHFASKCLKNGDMVTAYCCRHQIASDMKAEKKGDEFIAKALGHRSVAALQGYGSVKSKSKGVCPSDADASFKVRSNARREKKHKYKPFNPTNSANH